jgi:hypothetical protein
MILNLWHIMDIRCFTKMNGSSYNQIWRTYCSQKYVTLVITHQFPRETIIRNYDMVLNNVATKNDEKRYTEMYLTTTPPLFEERISDASRLMLPFAVVG